MRTGYIQGHWPCEVLEVTPFGTSVRYGGRVLTFQPWLVEPRRRR